MIIRLRKELSKQGLDAGRHPLRHQPSAATRANLAVFVPDTLTV